MGHLLTASQALLVACVLLIIAGVVKAAAIFGSDDWDHRPQWQREADYLSQFIPRGRL